MSETESFTASTHPARPVVSHSLCHTLPSFAASSLNRCNIPANILGSCTYQHYPVPLILDFVHDLHKDFFRHLTTIDTAQERAAYFQYYMRSAFLLGQSEQAGFSAKNRGIKRDKSDYLRLLRGWMFDADSIEAAVIKRWVESRFGLLTLNHKGMITRVSDQSYQIYLKDYVRGLYNSNALESQLDLLYCYCQYELKTQYSHLHLTLYRGISNINHFYQIPAGEKFAGALLLNNMNSFSDNQYQAEIFGDKVICCQVPTSKILYFPKLIAGSLNGEDEYLVLGGMYLCQSVK
ncbi:NAD(+)--dinitrogen-reductase ADP-D-ribosyltransferase [Vibrio nitrifigilis]|uniref:NAD(+)--dinitrogen-reductase ADP-D-ribosyltransferase n=1 Tax=Vibrio nitrifigilis TaxID=2789781 RepID=UPI001E60BCE3|nr:NAD(+)--dinitrogen-reductase ADP-D-ribosyltransferase [Vibrio nitrifigilis]